MQHHVESFGSTPYLYKPFILKVLRPPSVLLFLLRIVPLISTLGLILLLRFVLLISTLSLDFVLPLILYIAVASILCCRCRGPRGTRPRSSALSRRLLGVPSRKCTSPRC